MITLGIESTAHTVSIGITDGAEVLAISNRMYVPEEGGIHPREAANSHAQVIGTIMQEALASADMSMENIELAAFSQGPGLGPCLRIGATAARVLSTSLGIPLVGVNHCVAHLEVGTAVTDAQDPVLLYASGANTQVIAFSNGKYRVFGETLDVGIGNMLDKFAREQGIPFPGGPKLEKLALEGDFIRMPYSVKGMDVSFSGILTAALQMAKKGVSINDLAFSLQETTFAMLIEVAERAMAHTGKDELLLGGGVAANTRLQNMSTMMAEDRGARAFIPPKRLMVDNGAMIAITGEKMFNAGVSTAIGESQVRQRFRTDEVEVTWR